MRTNKYLYFVLCTFVLGLMSSCEPRPLGEEDVLISSSQVDQILQDENPDGLYKIYNINDFLDTFCQKEEGNFMSDSSLYRTRSKYGDLDLFSIDTLPVEGPGIYLRGRIATDDYGGNFYKSLVIQQVTDWETDTHIDQQCLRVSLDMGSANGMFQQGQELLIRCNGLAVGRYANQPQLCVPSYNNNVYADKASEKTGWAPGRIPSAIFRKATHMIGSPDKSKLEYDIMDLATLQTNYLSQYQEVVNVRKMDGRLVQLTNVHFSGTCDNNGTEQALVRYNPETNEGDPEVKDSYAYVFAPTTGNVGFPQSRYVKDASETNKVLVSTSEYARYAHFYLPSAKYVGSVTGVLSYYMDNGKYDPDGGEWSVTPCNLDAILPECQKEGADPQWIPTEWKQGVSQPVE